MQKLKYKIGPDGKKTTLDGKKVGRPKNSKTDGNVSKFKDDLMYVWNKLGGRVEFLRWAKKDKDKNYPKVLNIIASLQAKEVFQTSNTKTEIHVINDKAQEIVDQIKNDKLKLVK